MYGWGEETTSSNNAGRSRQKHCVYENNCTSSKKLLNIKTRSQKHTLYFYARCPKYSDDVQKRVSKTNDPGSLASVSADNLIYVQAVANLMGKLKILKFDFLLQELDEKDEEIKDLQQAMWKMYENCMALRYQDEEPFPEITDNIDDYITT